MIKKSVKYYLFAGLLSILPILLTYWLISKIFSYFSKPGAIIVEIIFAEKIPPYVPELTGFILTLLFIYFIGIFTSNIIGKKIFNKFESVLFSLPVVNSIYRTIKQILTSLSTPDTKAFKKVVLIEYPRPGLWALSLVTGESKSLNGDLYYHVFIPTTPNPTSGYFVYILKKDAHDLDMSIEEGMKNIISGGLLSSDQNMLP